MMFKNTNKQLLAYITDKHFFPVWIFLIIMVMFDLNTRFNTQSNSAQSNWQISEQLITPKGHLQQQDADIILAGFKKFEQNQANKINQPTKLAAMSLAEQANQQGLLSQLYIGNLRYRLVGVFTDDEAFAVLQQTDITNAEQTLVKVKAGDMLNQYQVKQINSNQVTIHSNSQIISLDLYKKQLASEQ